MVPRVKKTQAKSANDTAANLGFETKRWQAADALRGSMDAIYVAGASPSAVTVLDHFAGSGTTGHAVINLNREDGGRRYLVYGGRIDHRQIAVIWRETEGWQKADFERDKRFVAEQKLAESVDGVFVNGDSFISNARALEPIFKARMFAPVEA